MALQGGWFTKAAWIVSLIRGIAVHLPAVQVGLNDTYKQACETNCLTKNGWLPVQFNLQIAL